jgi:hypothetical protein
MNNGNNYLIPANSKKSQLILGIFNMVDLIVFISGVGFSVLLLLLIKSDNLGVMLGLASPAIVSAFLIAPIPNYHNVMTLIGNIWRFFTGRKKYYWRG